MKEHSRRSVERILPRVREVIKNMSEEEQKQFENRLHTHFRRVFELFIRLYGHHYDFFYHLENLILIVAQSYRERPLDLKALDIQREVDPSWYQSEEMVGGVLYVDLFSDNLARLKEFMSYFQELGLTYLHLMPLFAIPRGDSDGGYAVSDYRSVNPAIGTMEELSELAKQLRENGISLVLDFVFNHTSDEHKWALKAREGDPIYRDFYYLFPDRNIPDQYERHLRDIFPTVRKGSFTWREDIQRWVWTTFNSFQWDLNYSNPAVFCKMAEEMLFLANRGVEILRLDAVAFIWKRMGTDCENQPEAHMIIQAFNAIARIAAPSLLFKSEAIVHPDEVLRYIHYGECQLSYNPLLMALLWEALATREVRLLEHAMYKRSRISENCSWVNYLRCHDDIGWTFDDNDAREVGINPQDHRKFLNNFYTGEFPGSFARGVPFQYDPVSGDQRISGTLASLAGLEQALVKNDHYLVEMAIARIVLLRSVILSIGGIPLFFLGGEEWGVLNDYSYITDVNKSKDSRWIHRPKLTNEELSKRKNPEKVEKRIFEELVQLIDLKKRLPALRNGGMEVVSSGNPHIFTYIRQHEHQRLLILSNFSEYPQFMDANRVRLHGAGYRFHNLVTGEIIMVDQAIHLGPYQFLWLEHV